MEQYEIIYDWCGEESEETNLKEIFTGNWFELQEHIRQLRSLSGKNPTANITIGTARTYAHNNGSGYEQSAFYQLLFRQCAYILKFKHLNSQTAVGRGYVDDGDMYPYTRNTGETNAYGMDCEIIKQSKSSRLCKFPWIEGGSKVYDYGLSWLLE